MDKSELRTNRIDNNDKPLKGLQNKGLMNFECADCGKSLLVLQLTAIEEDNKNKAKVLTRVAVKCMDCGGFSYVQQISGSFYPGAPNDNMAFDILDDHIGAPVADVFFKVWSK